MTFWAIDNPRLSCFAFLRKWIRTLDWFLAQWKLLVAICLTWKSGWNDLWRSVLGEVVGMSYHQSWPRHQTRKRHHSLQVCQPILPFISNNINKDREQERIEWTSSIFGVQNKLLKPHALTPISALPGSFSVFWDQGRFWSTWRPTFCNFHILFTHKYVVSKGTFLWLRIQE